MPRPEIFGVPAARKKRARKPWTLQRTISNTFIAFIYLLPFFSSVFSNICSLLCWVRSEIGPDGLALPDEQSGGERPPLDPRSPRSELSLFSAPLTRTRLPSPDPAAALPPAQEPAGPRPRRRPDAEAFRP